MSSNFHSSAGSPSNSSSFPPLLILAGGKATRLKNLSQSTPKYLMPVSKTETFAEVHLQWARSQGFERVILSLGYLGDQIQKHCGNGERWGLQIEYIEDGLHPAGTGGALREALKLSWEEICITYGDTLLSFSVKDFLQDFHRFSGLGAMTLLKNTVPGHQANAAWSGAEVLYDKFNPAKDWQWIDYGFLVLHRKAVESFSPERPLDLALPLHELSKEKKILGWQVHDRFWEIGSPEALEEFQKRHKELKPRL